MIPGLKLPFFYLRKARKGNKMALERMKPALKILFIIGLIIAIWLIASDWLTPSPKRVPTQSITQRSRVKRVRFRPTVTVGSAGGSKVDRYNPELKPGVARNASLAARVGGARRLAHLSLLEATSASSSEEA